MKLDIELLICICISSKYKITIQNCVNPALQDAEHLPDHLLHGGGPAHIQGLTVALVHVHPGPADGADQVSIAAVKYLQGRPHALHADGTLRDQGGRRVRLGSLQPLLELCL
jgi:hypothetical protein